MGLAGLDPRQLLLERNQRRRQKPTWLQNSIDPKSVKELRTVAALRAAVRPFSHFERAMHAFVISVLSVSFCLDVISSIEPLLSLALSFTLFPSPFPPSLGTAPDASLSECLRTQLPSPFTLPALLCVPDCPMQLGAVC